MRAGTFFPLKDVGKTKRFSHQFLATVMCHCTFYSRCRGLTVDCASENWRIPDLEMLFNIGLFKDLGDSQVMLFLPSDMHFTIIIFGALVCTWNPFINCTGSAFRKWDKFSTVLLFQQLFHFDLVPVSQSGLHSWKILCVRVIPRLSAFLWQLLSLCMKKKTCLISSNNLSTPLLNRIF